MARVCTASSFDTATGSYRQKRSIRSPMASFIQDLFKASSARHGSLQRQPPTNVGGPCARVAASLLMVTLLFGSSQVQPVSTQLTHNACNSPNHFVNETFNPMGPNTCQSDCDCDGMRRCSFSRWCFGVARGPSPPPAVLPSPPRPSATSPPPSANPPPPSASPPPPRPAGNLRNLALWRPAYASSKSSESYLVVDGGKGASDGAFETDSRLDSEHWLSVDLQASCYVSFIVLYARKDCCGEQLINTEIRAGAFSFDDMGMNELMARLNPYGGGTTGAVYNISINPPVEARWISVQNFNRNIMAIKTGLVLLELEVYGSGPQPPVSSYKGGGGRSAGSTGGGIGGNGFRLLYTLGPLGGVLLMVVTCCVFFVARKRLIQLRMAAAMDLHNVIATPHSMPPPSPPATLASGIGTPVYGMPFGSQHNAASGSIPMFVASVGAGGQAMSEWMRKQKEQQQRQPGDAAGSSSSSSVAAPAVACSPEGVVMVAAAWPSEPSSCSPCSGAPAEPILGCGGTAAGKSPDAAKWDAASQPHTASEVAAAEALQPPRQGRLTGQGQQPPATASYLPQGSLSAD